jgi:hypothetical protein
VSFGGVADGDWMRRVIVIVQAGVVAVAWIGYPRAQCSPAIAMYAPLSFDVSLSLPPRLRLASSCYFIEIIIKTGSLLRGLATLRVRLTRLCSEDTCCIPSEFSYHLLCSRSQKQIPVATQIR